MLCYNTKIAEKRTGNTIREGYSNAMLIIGIAGGTGSGKTTVARSVIDRLGSENVTFISQDNYYKNPIHLSLAQRKLINYDHPLSFDIELLAHDLHLLREGRTAHAPVYDFSVFARVPDETVELQPNRIVILE